MNKENEIPVSAIVGGRYGVKLNNVSIRGYKSGVTMTDGGDLDAKNVTIDSEGDGILIHESSNKSGNDHWYKKPVGIVAIGITTGITVLILRALAMAFFPEWFK